MTQPPSVEAIYFSALEKGTPEERNAYLDTVCGPDAALRRRVERLLAAHEQLGSFLDSPAIPPLSEGTPHGGETNRNTPASPNEPPAPECGIPTPDTSPRYELGAEIGRGGMGQVLLGRDAGFDREVAVKVLLESHQGRPDLARRFIAEARIAGKLQHPGIVPVYEMGRLPDRRPYFSMKLVKGRTLAQLLATRHDRGRDQTHFLGIFLQVCQTVAYAHSQEVIHRDLKPANVMVGAFGEVQVMDWGLAKELHSADIEDGPRAAPPRAALVESDRTPLLTDSRMVAGTPAYLPPELARREPGAASLRSDVFELGGILCEILTGQPPFGGKTVLEQLSRSAAGNLTDAFSRLDACGADTELIRLAKWFLAPSPADRPADAGEVASAVSAYLAGVQERLRAAELGKAKAETRAEGERRRRVLVVALAAAVLLVAVGGGTAAWLVQQERTRQREDAGKAMEVALAARGLMEQGWTNQDSVRLGQARAELGRAADLARRGNLPADRQAEITSLLADADRQIARVGQNRILLDALLDVALPEETAAHDAPARGGTLARKTRDQQYADAFRYWGLDIDAADPVAAVARLREEPAPVRDEVIAALDNWTVIRRQKRQGTPWQRLWRLADELDPDDARRQLRATTFGNGLAQPGRGLAAVPLGPAIEFAQFETRHLRLRQLRELRRPMTQPALSVLLLARVMADTGDPVAAEQVVRAALATRPGEVMFHIFLGVLLEQQGQSRRAEAIGSYRAARAIRPGLGLVLALALSHSGKTADAREAEAILRDLMRQQPDSPEVHFHLGYVLHEQKMLAEAATEYREAIRLKPDYPAAHNNLGVVLRDLNKLPEAEAEFREAIRRKPDLAMAHNNLGVVLVAQNKLAEAVAAYREALRIQPDYAEAHNNLGNALKLQNQLPEAAAAYGEAIRLKPDFLVTYISLGDIRKAQNKLPEAAAAYREAIRLKPDYLDAYLELGVALKAQKQYPEAAATFREAIRLKPDFALAHFNLGVVLVAQNKPAEAAASYREAVRIDPAFFEAYRNLGFALKRQNQYADAAGAYREAIRIKPDSAEAHYDLGSALAGQNRHADAAAAYREAIRLKPDFPEPHFNLGVSLLAQDKLAEASEAYREAIRLKPDYPEPHLNLGDILRRQGKFTESLELIRRGHELGSKQPGWAYPSAAWLRLAERRVELDKRLPAVLAGQATPKDATERVEIAQLCVLKGRPADAVRFYADAFRADPAIATVNNQYRFKAACAAVRAAAATGDDAPDEPGRARLRTQALDWLRADLAEWTRAFVLADAETRPVIARTLGQWLSSPDLAGVRDPDAVARLPRPEQEGWRSLWQEVVSLRRRAAENK